jgi:hypothetical protein
MGFKFAFGWIGIFQTSDGSVRAVRVRVATILPTHWQKQFAIN